MKEVIVEFLDEFRLQFKNLKKYGIKNQIPNMLTFSRAIAPIIVIPTVLFGKIKIAIIELILFELTDFFDGRIARKLNCVTDFGVKLDAICDKFFVLGIMIPAIIKYPVLIINLILEACISYINFVALIKNNDPKSNMIGKIKTGFLSVTMVLSYIPNIESIYILMISIFTFMLQIIAFIKYREVDLIKDTKKKK